MYIMNKTVDSFNVRDDWLLKLRIFCTIYLRATQENMASRFAAVTSEEIIQINFCGVYYLTVLVYTKTTIHRSVGGYCWIFTSPLRGSVNIHR